MIEARNLRKTTYRLYPTPKQVFALDALLRSHQQLYNAALEERISAWSKAGKSISYADQCKSLTLLRRELPEWRDAANCSSQQMTLRRLDKAFTAFFRRVKAGQTPGFPRFKSLGRFSGFSFKSHGDGWRFTPTDGWKHGSLRLSGVGQIRARGQARQGGEIRASDILHRDGRWYLSLTVAVASPERTRQADGAMAYDWGVERFLSGVTHTGELENIDNPRWWQQEREQTIRLQQAVSRKANRRSNRRKKAVRRLAAARAKVARKRLDWAHQQTAALAGKYALVATEELTLKNMTRSGAGTAEEPGNSGHRPWAVHFAVSLQSAGNWWRMGGCPNPQTQTQPALPPMLACGQKAVVAANALLRAMRAPREQGYGFSACGALLGFGINIRSGTGRDGGL